MTFPTLPKPPSLPGLNKALADASELLDDYRDDPDAPSDQLALHVLRFFMMAIPGLEGLLGAVVMEVEEPGRPPGSRH